MNLYYVMDEQKRLGIIAGYTIAFAICVGLITKARRSKVFAACAAYAAVVFVFALSHAVPSQVLAFSCADQVVT